MSPHPAASTPARIGALGKPRLAGTEPFRTSLAHLAGVVGASLAELVDRS